MTYQISDGAREALAEDPRCPEVEEGDRCMFRRGHLGLHMADSGRHGWLHGHDLADTVLTVPNTPGTPRRTIRVPDALWDAAQAKAEKRGESVSDVIRRALDRYVKGSK